MRRARTPIAALVLYVAAFFAFHQTFGPIMAALAIAPVCTTAWVFGWRAGLAAGLLAVPLDFTLAALVHDPGGSVTQAAPGFAAIIGTGMFVGWASALNRRANVANAELLAVARSQADFISIVSHEFRTPLTGIQGFSEMIRDDDLTIAEAKDLAADINDDALRLGRMISEMLDLDRMRLGAIALHREPLDLNALVRYVATRLTLGAPDHRLRLELDASLPPMVGDRDRLTQVLTNLVSNAVKYSPRGSDVTVSTSTRTRSSALQVSVTDHGFGIAASDLERVFEPYVRVGSSATRDIQGTGLGLPIAREIVRLHGGTMWAESVVGQGSRFHFTLALDEPRAGPASVPPGLLQGHTASP
ncbi:MAG: sensor histidine kinase [Candidatus Limnocylindria bacterium]